METESRIEVTDTATPRLSQAARSLTSWYHFEKDRLGHEFRLFNDELEKENNPGKQLELKQAIRENCIELKNLQTGWKNSTLRAKLTPHQTAEQLNQVEHRFTSASAAGKRDTVLKPPEGNLKSIHKLTGYATKFDSDSQLLYGAFIERIMPGAFADALKTSDARFLLNHSSDYLLARQSSKSLRLYEDSIGLRFYCDLIPGDSISESTKLKVGRGDLNGMSFGFTVEKDRWQLAQKPSEIDRRFIVKIGDLFEISCCVWPAYLGTEIVLCEREVYSPERRKLFDQWDKERNDLIDAEIAAEKRKQQSDYNKAGRIMNRCRAAVTAVKN